jgi:hypothetical protein
MPVDRPVDTYVVHADFCECESICRRLQLRDMWSVLLPEESHRNDVKKESLVTGRISQYLMTPVPRMECGAV